MVYQTVKTFPAVHGTRKLIAVLTMSCLSTLFRARWLKQHHLTMFIYKITVPAATSFSKPSLPFTFSDQSCVLISYRSHVLYVRRPSDFP
jgi:hypothetical protein